MKKVLQYVPSYNYGGIESFTYELNKQLKDVCKFVYLVEKDVDGKTAKKLHELGAEVVRIPNMTKESFWGYISAVRRLFKVERFDAVHVHDCNNRFLVTLTAKMHGVKCRVYHVHSKDIGGSAISKLVKRIGIRLNVWLSTIRLVCSEEAANAKGVRKYKIVKNCITAEDFRFDEKKRNAVRKEHGLNQDDIVLLFIGRVEKVKNVGFLLKVLKNLPEEKRQQYVLIVIGDGSELSSIKQIAKGIDGCRIIFAGRKYNTADYYSASDYFCLPSLAEGFPITLLEAQANGLSCLVSTNVPNVVNLNKRVRFLSINDVGAKEWVNVLLKHDEIPKKERSKGVNLIKELKYDSLSTAEEVGRFYGALE